MYREGNRKQEAESRKQEAGSRKQEVVVEMTESEDGGSAVFRIGRKE